MQQNLTDGVALGVRHSLFRSELLTVECLGILFICLLFPQGLIHSDFKSVGRFVSQKPSIDKDRGGPMDTHLAAEAGICIDLSQHLGRVHSGLELTGIQTERGPNFYNFCIVQLVIILKKQIMEFPKHALTLGGQGRLSGFDGKGVSADGEVFKNNFDFFGVLLEHLLEYRHQPGAIRSLEIAEYDDTDRRIGPSFDGRAVNVDIFDNIDLSPGLCRSCG